MKLFSLAVLLLTVPMVASAHREVLCDGVKTVVIRVQKGGIAQVKSQETITGTYAAMPQREGFIQYDKGHPGHIFRVDASKMEQDAVNVHLNTVKHQCLMQIRSRRTRYDSIVTVNFPPTPLEQIARLSRPLRESPVRQMWDKQWVMDKTHGPPTVKVEPATGPLPGWIEGVSAQLMWHYTMPGYEGFTVLLHNTTQQQVSVRLEAIVDPSRPIHSMNLTDTLGSRSWRGDGTLLQDEKALLHITYQLGGQHG